MNKGLEILMSRMESNPDEFEDPSCFGALDPHVPYPKHGTRHRWAYIFDALATKVKQSTNAPNALGTSAEIDRFGFVSHEDAVTVLNKYYSIQSDAFTTTVMKTLLNAEDHDAKVRYVARESGMGISQYMLTQQRNALLNQSRQGEYIQVEEDATGRSSMLGSISSTLGGVLGRNK